MTPEERAYYLVDQFMIRCEFENAKQAAKICVEQIIITVTKLESYAARSYKTEEIKFWNLVLVELQNIKSPKGESLIG